MTAPRDEQLIESLVRNLTPVRRVVRLRVALALALGTGAAVGAATLGRGSVTPELVRRIATPGAFSAVLCALAAVSLGGLASAFATTRPDRARAVRGGALALAAGLAVGTLACVLSSLLADDPARAFQGTTPLAGDLGCLAKGLALGALPLLVALWLAGRGVARRPLRTVALAGAGAVALGALTVHLACAADGMRHMLVAHALAPLLGSLVAAPFAIALRRGAGRPSAS